MKQRAFILAFLSFLASAFAAAAVFAAPGPAGDTAAMAAAQPWKAEDVVFGETAEEFRISPDGKWVVWVKNTVDKEKDGRISNLFLSSLTEKKEIQLTRGSDQNHQPRWSPNGELVAFLSTRPRPQAKPDAAPAQIWLIHPHGGEPWPLGELPRGAQRFEWLDDDTILFSAEEDPTLYEQEIKKKKDDSQVVEDETHAPPVRLYKMGVKDGKVTRLTNNTDWIGAWAVSRNGRYAAASHQRSLRYEWDQKVPPVTILHNLTNGEEKTIFTEGRIRPLGFLWTQDSLGFYAVAPYSTDPRFLTAFILKLHYYDVAGGSVTLVDLDWENGVGFEVEITPDGFVAQLAAGARFEPARYTMEESGSGRRWKRALIEGEHVRNMRRFTVSEDGRRIVYEYSTASRLPQWFGARLDGARVASPEQITDLNESLAAGRTFAKTEVIRWKGALDEQVEGILYYPHNYEAGKKYPLILNIHGGPTGWDSDAWDDNWAYPINLLNQRGAFVLRPNYHGSGNYGLKWAESICCGKYYDLETPDIEKGVDFLIAQGKVDPERVATMGWSNGAILSINLTVSNPGRYKVASVGAGDIEWISDWGNVDFGEAFDSYYFGKSPLEDPELYIRKSPFFKMDRVQAPTLIFFGTADRNVPPDQGWSHYRALQYHAKAPVRFVLFPGEPHGPRKLTHQLRKVEEEMAWFDRYFFKTEKPGNEALRADSALADVLRRKSIGRVGTKYGMSAVRASVTTGAKERKRGASRSAESPVIPEVVQRGGLLIGRFEVTRAQYAEFDKKYSVPAGTDNFPANGISLAQAKAYAEWVSRRTGQQWRLATEEETAKLYESREGENTLDHWAGYAPNPDDTKRLREKAKELPGDAPLLKEAGSFHGQGKDEEEPIFDLGGNVAEWVVTRDGKGKIAGGSADCPADPKAVCTPNAAYVGFRVVRDALKPAPTASSSSAP